VTIRGSLRRVGWDGASQPTHSAVGINFVLSFADGAGMLVQTWSWPGNAAEKCLIEGHQWTEPDEGLPICGHCGAQMLREELVLEDDAELPT
jgi:hypothetical protein